MKDSATTQCWLFKGLSTRPVDVRFSGEATSSDGGALLLEGVDRKLGLIKAMSEAIIDHRDPTRVKHDMKTLVGQRVFALGCGYEDGNDAAKLASDPVMKLIAGRDPSGEDLASQPSISRFENSVGKADLFRLATAIVQTVIERQRIQRRGCAEKITIDFDQTVDKTHGEQQQSLFNGYYRSHCFIPLLGAMTFNDEPEQIPFVAVLRAGNSPDKKGTIAVLSRVLPRLRKAFPTTRFTSASMRAFPRPRS